MTFCRRVTTEIAAAFEEGRVTIPDYPAEPHAWDRAQVYNRPEVEWLTWPPCRPEDGEERVYTPEYMDACKRETEWQQCESTPTLTAEQEKAVGLGQIKCPICDGRCDYGVLHHGVLTGIDRLVMRNCGCKRLCSFWREWQHTPLRFQGAGPLAELKPYAELRLSIERQEAILEGLKAHPEHSYLMLGPPKTGKSFLLLALYREALQRSLDQQVTDRYNSGVQSVFYVNATHLLAQQSAWAFEQNKEFPDPNKEPTVTPEKIARAIKQGYRVGLFVDEIDKVSFTGSKMSGLCMMVNLVYESCGQLVANSNELESELALRWGVNEAGTLLRRFGDGDNAWTIMFEDKPEACA
jgi:hypothetical protein